MRFFLIFIFVFTYIVSLLAVPEKYCIVEQSNSDYIILQFDFPELNIPESKLSSQIINLEVPGLTFNYEENKEWKYEGELPSVIDFYADWCGPCKMIAPIIEELSQEYDGKVNFYKIDTEAEQELAGAFGIQSIPSLLFIPKVGKPQMAAGALPKETMKEVIEKELIAE